jgi:hypothetical protein
MFALWAWVFELGAFVLCTLKVYLELTKLKTQSTKLKVQSTKF